MSKAPTRALPILLSALALLMIVVMVGACSDEDTATTLTTSSSASADPSPDGSTPDTEAEGTFTQDNERVVVGGKTAEEYEEMIPTLEQSLQDNPDDLQTLQDLAIAEYNTDRYEEAAATYEKMLSLENTAFTRNNYANVLRDWGQTEDAIANYEDSISLDKTLVTPYLNLASLLIREGQVDEAVAVLESALPEVSVDDQARVETYLEQIEGATTSSS